VVLAWIGVVSWIVFDRQRTFPVKASIVYHGSKNIELITIKSMGIKKQNSQDAPRLYASPSKAVASVFIVPWDDSWAYFGKFSQEEPYSFVCGDKNKFFEMDKGGAIYTLDAKSFVWRNKGLRENECWISQDVVPLDKIILKSALDAMIENGVRVFFVDNETWQKIKKSPDRLNFIRQIVTTQKPFIRSMK